MMGIKGFFGTLLGTVIGGESLRQTSNINFPGGLGRATQSFIGLGIVGNAAKNAKESFKWFK
jgi:hypothetical protein